MRDAAAGLALHATSVHVTVHLLCLAPSQRAGTGHPVARQAHPALRRLPAAAHRVLRGHRWVGLVLGRGWAASRAATCSRAAARTPRARPPNAVACPARLRACAHPAPQAWWCPSCCVGARWACRPIWSWGCCTRCGWWWWCVCVCVGGVGWGGGVGGGVGRLQAPPMGAHLACLGQCSTAQQAHA